MDVSGLQIGFDALVALIVSIAGALGVWHTLKGKVAIQQLILDSLKTDLAEIKSDKKETHDLLHSRINELKGKVEANREKNDQALADLKSEMQQMEIRIINAINEKK
jgi:gas vesicle protein